MTFQIKQILRKRYLILCRNIFKFHNFLFLQKIRKQSDEWKKRYDEQLIAFEQKQHEREMKVERKKASTDLVCLRRDALVNSHLKVS